MVWVGSNWLKRNFCRRKVVQAPEPKVWGLLKWDRQLFFYKSGLLLHGLLYY
jgi:hypothetical protein